MNIGYETETVEFKKSTGELKEGAISFSSMLLDGNKGLRTKKFFRVVISEENRA